MNGISPNLFDRTKTLVRRNWLPFSLVLVTLFLFMSQRDMIAGNGNYNRDNNAKQTSPIANNHQREEYTEKVESASPDSTSPSIWVSMAVCWSGNTHFHKKENFNYTAATKFSTSLWHLKTNHKTIVYVIYDDKDEGDQKLLDYAQDLRKIGSRVELVPTGDVLTCSLKAQLQRMFAFQLPYVAPGDIILTSDVDTFVMYPYIFDPIKDLKYEAWIFQYDDTLANEFTFNMNFIGMRSSKWRHLFKEIETCEVLVKTYTERLELTEGKMWDYDQLILTTMILEERLCTIPHSNALWGKLLFSPPDASDPILDDSERCFHGEGQWRDCNIMRKSLPTGCVRWHFHPHEKLIMMQSIYDQIYEQSVAHAVNVVEQLHEVGDEEKIVVKKD